MAVSTKEKEEYKAWVAQNGLNENTSPAVLLYFEDFLVGVSDMTMEERGQYITLLCLQNAKGHLTKNAIDRAMRPEGVSPYVLEKFAMDPEGRYFNERMDYEIYRRVKRAKTLADNLNGSGQDTKAETFKPLSPWQQKELQKEMQKVAQKAAQKEIRNGDLTEIETEKEKEKERDNNNKRGNEPTPWYRRTAT